METKKLKESVKCITMPKEVRERIEKRCRLEMEGSVMKEHKTNKSAKRYFRNPAIAAAALILCVCMTGVTALAATGNLQGFFKDIKNWTGAVTGTSYEQATDEIKLEIAEAGESLTVTAVMVYPEKPPYSAFENFGIERYSIIDTEGKVLVKGEKTEMTELINGVAEMVIPLENIPAGKYQLVVEAFVGSAKADQPLVVNGMWTCDFVR